MSIIAAGTSSGTALVSTGDTNGTLVIQTNGTTVAATFGTDQKLTLAGALVTTGVSTFAAGSAAAPSITTTGDTNTGVFFPAADTIGFSEGGAEAMRIDSSGNVGIGTSSGTRKLNVYGGASSTRTMTVTSNASEGLEVGVNASNIAAINSAAGGAIIFTQADTERARIDSSGNLLVGTTSQTVTEKFCVNGTGTYVAAFNQGTNTSGYNVLRLGLNPNGNNTSTYFLQGNTNTVGNWFLYGNGTTSFSSDSRLKKNIETTRDGYLEDVAKLRVVKYNWRNDEEGKLRELGLIAQEVEQVFPGLVQDDKEKVSEDDETRYKSLKQSVLPFILLKAIQELKAEFDAYKAAHP